MDESELEPELDRSERKPDEDGASMEISSNHDSVSVTGTSSGVWLCNEVNAAQQ